LPTRDGRQRAIEWQRGDVAIKTLCCEPAGREFEFQWCHWNFSATGRVDSASNRKRVPGIKFDYLCSCREI